ncbi:MAG: hypothetical protein ACK4L7_05830 [Flavobacteriales bacterium]
MRRMPFSYGFDFGWQRMGSKRQEVPVNVQSAGANTGTLTVRSNIYSYHGLLRLQPLSGKVSPFADFMAGTRHFITRSEVMARGVDEPVITDRLSSEAVGSIGWAVGIDYAPARQIFTEVRLERRNGGKVSYVDPESITIDAAGNVGYSTLTSGSRVVNLTFGVGFRF